MKTVKLSLDFLNGPIWKDIYDIKQDTLITGIECVDSDETLRKINNTIQEKYNSFYSFSEDNVSCCFDEYLFNKSKKELAELMNQLKCRLEELNDGSFEIEDYITSGLESD